MNQLYRIVNLVNFVLREAIWAKSQLKVFYGENFHDCGSQVMLKILDCFLCLGAKSCILDLAKFLKGYLCNLS